MHTTATEYRYSIKTVPEMSIVSQLQVSVCAPDSANCAHTLKSTDASLDQWYYSRIENKRAGANTKAVLVPTNSSGGFGNAAVVGGIFEIGGSETHTFRIAMTAGKTYIFDETYRKWALMSGEWRGKEHFYLPDEWRISLYTKNSAGQLEPVAGFQNQPENGWQGTYGDPDFQTFPFALWEGVAGNDQYFALVGQLSFLFANAHLFPPGSQHDHICKISDLNEFGNLCGADLDITKDDGRLLRTASYTPTESGVYYLQVTRVHDDAPEWGPDTKGSAYYHTVLNKHGWRYTELVEAWYIPIAGYDTNSSSSGANWDDVDENDDPTYMLMYNGHQSPNRKALPYYEISVEVSGATATQQAANTPATGGPGIQGSPRNGETLTATTSGIADEDGMTGAVFAYQWIRHDLATATDTDIEGATGSTYTVTAEDEGKGFKVRVNFTDDAGNEESVTSYALVGSPSPTRTREPANSAATGAPGIEGSAVVGQTLKATTSEIVDDDGIADAVFNYQWLADDAAIGGATASTYTVLSGDVGKVIKVTVTFTDDAGNDETLTSAATGAVAAANSPATGAPTISGTAQAGGTLTADTSGIADSDGLGGVTFAYRWLADDAAIEGATASTYTVLSGDVGKAIKVKVTFTDDAGNEESLTNNATAAVTQPLTATIHDAPDSHDGQSKFTFELRFSEQFGLSYKTLRDHAFTVTGGEVVKARRLEKGKNVRWEIHVRPDSANDVTIVLPATTDCDAQGAVCTEDGRMLSSRLELTVAGP